MKTKETLEILRKAQGELDETAARKENEESGEELTDEQKLEKAFDDKMAGLVTEPAAGENADGEQQNLFKANDANGNAEDDKKKKKKKDDEDENAEGKAEGKDKQANLFKKSIDENAEIVEELAERLRAGWRAALPR